MPDRSKLDSIFEAGSKELRELLEKAPELKDQLHQLQDELQAQFGRLRRLQDRVKHQIGHKAPRLLDELKTVARHPRALGTRLESASPWVNRRFLSAASNVIEPFLAGMGFRVLQLGEEAVEIWMPGGRKNQGSGGLIHPGALTTLGEFSTRLFWEHHLDLRHSELEVRRIELRVLARATGEMRAIFRLPTSEREAILHRLRARQRAEVDGMASIYDANGRLVAEVEVTWLLMRHLALGPAGQSADQTKKDS